MRPYFLWQILFERYIFAAGMPVHLGRLHSERAGRVGQRVRDSAATDLRRQRGREGRQRALRGPGQ